MYQGFPKMRGPLFDKNVRKADLVQYGGATQTRTGGKGFADLCLTTWLWRRKVETRSLLEQVTRLELATSTLARWRSTR